MIGRRRLLATTIVTSITCLLVLYAYAWSIMPRTQSIGEIRSDDVGSLVRTRGHVTSLVTLSSGGVRITLMDYKDLATLPAYIPENIVRSIPFLTDVVPGCMLRVTGEVQEFGGHIEISISDSAGVELLAEAKENRMELNTLALNPEAFDGMQLMVRGRVGELEQIIDRNKVMISSGHDSLWVDVHGQDVKGGRVDVLGKFLHNEERGRFEIKVASESDRVSQHPVEIPAGYTVVSLDNLSSNPEPSEGLTVAVLNVSAAVGETIGTLFVLSDSVGDARYSISCIVFGWDWASDKRGIDEDTVAEFLGTWGYYTCEARWQVTSDYFTLRF